MCRIKRQALLNVDANDKPQDAAAKMQDKAHRTNGLQLSLAQWRLLLCR